MTKQLSQILPAFENAVVAADGTKIDDLSEINTIPVSNLVLTRAKPARIHFILHSPAHTQTETTILHRQF